MKELTQVDAVNVLNPRGEFDQFMKFPNCPIHRARKSCPFYELNFKNAIYFMNWPFVIFEIWLETKHYLTILAYSLDILRYVFLYRYILLIREDRE